MSPRVVSFTGLVVLISISSMIVPTECSSPLINAVLNQFSREDLIKECEGFAVEGDRVQMNGTVYLDSSLTDASLSVTLMIKRQNDSDFNIFHYTLTKNCKTDDAFYCEKKGSSDVFDIFINLIASDLLSEALLMLTVEYNDMRYNSTEVKLPKMFNLSKAALRINGKLVSQMKETIHLKETFIEFCCNLEHFPCNPVILPFFSPHTNGSNCIIIRPVNDDTIEYILGYVVCASSKYLQFHNVRIAVVLNQSNAVDYNATCIKELSCTQFTLLLITLCVLIIVIIISAILYYYFKVYRRRYNALQQSVSNPPNASSRNEARIALESARVPAANTNSHLNTRYRGGSKKKGR